jgi:transposase
MVSTPDGVEGMPFVSRSAMESRRWLVEAVTSGRLSLAEACRQAEVTRKTGRKWIKRAEATGIDKLAELSRAPKNVHRKTETPKEEALLELRAKFPEWGARKLVVLLERDQHIKLPARTADHILERHGLTKARPNTQELVRFERDTCGALLQMDFKGLPQSAPYHLLSVLDDHARFCFAFEPVADKTAMSIKAVLWELFGEHGMPESMLMDNGDCWGSVNSRFPTSFCVWLMLLGIKPIHGRPYHPQTQGKVERFHGTAKVEIGPNIVQPSIDLIKPICKDFVNRYNWVRPHDSLGGATPGSLYQPFPNKRPAALPVHAIPEGSTSRKVDKAGLIYYKGATLKVGTGLIGQRLMIKEDLLGDRLFFCNFPLPYLSEL